jgi:hypothetical protein
MKVFRSPLVSITKSPIILSHQRITHIISQPLKMKGVLNIHIRIRKEMKKVVNNVMAQESS